MNNKHEMGGYLPLELNPNSEYHIAYNKYTIRTCSGRSALYVALSIEKPESIYIPYYICNTVEEPITDLNVIIKRYHLTNDLLPDFTVIPEGSCVLLVNYFGIFNRQLETIVSKNYCFIIDNTQSFFSTPIIQDNIYNIYSCRKFIGVADGGYLISKNCELETFSLPSSTSSSHSLFLLESLENGTNYAYKSNLANEERLHNSYYSMSVFTKRLLCSTDYEYIKNQRINNWTFLHNKLKNYNKLSLPDTLPGYMYPFFYTNDIRQELINNNIYIPRLWKEALLPELKGSIEYELSETLIPLPIDQRYDNSDMKYLYNIIEHYLN